ncbi:MAG: four helix bundle protein [Bacilli bacterium]|nr:four helix bundle protein [Bacilli bacterium]
MNDKFKIARYIKDFIIILDDYLVNYPKKYFELRNRLVNDSYELLELVYLANYMDNLDRKNIQIKSLMKINIIDFYIEESYKKRIISEKQSIKLSNNLLIINKMIYKWVQDEKC